MFAGSIRDENLRSVIEDEVVVSRDGEEVPNIKKLSSGYMLVW